MRKKIDGKKGYQLGACKGSDKCNEDWTSENKGFIVRRREKHEA